MRRVTQQLQQLVASAAKGPAQVGNYITDGVCDPWGGGGYCVVACCACVCGGGQ